MKCEILKYKNNIFLQNIFYMWWLATTHEIIIIIISFSVSEKGVIAVHHANYGRRELGICPDNFVTRSDCYFPQTSSMQFQVQQKHHLFRPESLKNHTI